MIAEPTGTDGHRTIGRPWHAFPWKDSALAEVNCLSTRNMLPLPHLELIRSLLHLTIQYWHLYLNTFKLYLILAGKSRHLFGQV